MRAVVLEMDERTLNERERLGLDKRDEMWDGVLHLVPPPSERHQGIEIELALALRPAAKSRGWRATTDTGVFASASDYRVPDIVIYSPEAGSERGVDGAPEIVVEVASPGDESYEKVPWYIGRGAKAVLIIDRDTLVLKLYTQVGPVPPVTDGSVLLEPLNARVAPSDNTLVIDGTELEL
jgi:Uma2 family endonuclease